MRSLRSFDLPRARAKAKAKGRRFEPNLTDQVSAHCWHRTVTILLYAQGLRLIGFSGVAIFQKVDTGS